jgi:hypothetical protein
MAPLAIALRKNPRDEVLVGCLFIYIWGIEAELTICGKYTGCIAWVARGKVDEDDIEDL